MFFKRLYDKKRARKGCVAGTKKRPRLNVRGRLAFMILCKIRTTSSSAR